MKKIDLKVYKDVKCIDHTYEGLGTVKIEDNPVFVDNLLPGEIADIEIKKVNSRFGLGKVINLKKKSNLRTDECNEKLMKSGSASLANISYDNQLDFKENMVKYLFNRNIHFNNIEPVLKSEHIWNYRNKLTVFTKLIQNNIKIGLFEKNTHNLIEQDSYDLAQKPIEKLILWITKNINNYPEIVKSANCFDQLTVRYSSYSDKLLLIFKVLKPFKLPKLFIQDLKYNFSNLQSVLIVNNNRILNKYISENTCLIDKIGDYTFKLDWNSFFQINTYQTEKLYNLLFDNLKVNNSDIILDAYSGIGTIGIMLANKVKKVYGLEIIENATKNSIENAKLNSINNAEFYSGDVLQSIDKITEKINTIIVDPPREGLDNKFLNKILDLKPAQIGYISCNYHTMCRDIDLLTKSGYKLEYLRPCDMFSQTHHIEVVGVLTLK
ncbi:23S rRNA (uracil(1939)-C(5))-methyltransferase RlmD [Mycoplasmopsis felifaucium]|uniref:23S rRNA (Uracil(1939)-C(5))-methyltransferase RlmD n=1 Tax=Mycoplasmopsis felifaucium TaxID=35768 RepID=A0ABZ2RR56_9BACT